MKNFVALLVVTAFGTNQLALAATPPGEFDQARDLIRYEIKTAVAKNPSASIGQVLTSISARQKQLGISDAEMKIAATKEISISSIEAARAAESANVFVQKNGMPKTDQEIIQSLGMAPQAPKVLGGAAIGPNILLAFIPLAIAFLGIGISKANKSVTARVDAGDDIARERAEQERLRTEILRLQLENQKLQKNQ